MATMLSERVLNSKIGKQYKYVLECIENCSRVYDEGIEFETDLDKIRFFFECFNEEFNHLYNRKRYPNFQMRVCEFLRGLPSCFNIDYTNYQIIKIGKEWGFCQTEKKECEFVENWFSTIALRIIQIANKVGYNYTNMVM